MLQCGRTAAPFAASGRVGGDTPACGREHADGDASRRVRPAAQPGARAPSHRSGEHEPLRCGSLVVPTRYMAPGPNSVASSDTPP
jgi:hypothetical protein